VHYGVDAANVGGMLRALTAEAADLLEYCGRPHGQRVGYHGRVLLHSLCYVSMHSRVSYQPTTIVCRQRQLCNHYCRSFTTCGRYNAHCSAVAIWAM